MAITLSVIGIGRVGWFLSCGTGYIDLFTITKENMLPFDSGPWINRARDFQIKEAVAFDFYFKTF